MTEPTDLSLALLGIKAGKDNHTTFLSLVGSIESIRVLYGDTYDQPGCVRINYKSGISEEFSLAKEGVHRLVDKLQEAIISYQKYDRYTLKAGKQGPTSVRISHISSITQEDDTLTINLLGGQTEQHICPTKADADKSFYEISHLLIHKANS